MIGRVVGVGFGVEGKDGQGSNGSDAITTAEFVLAEKADLATFEAVFMAFRNVAACLAVVLYKILQQFNRWGPTLLGV